VVITRLLSQAGYTPLVARDGRSGITLAVQSMPDLILCDLEMPGMHGHQVLSTLHSNPETASIPVIFLTGQVEPGQVRDGMNLGADDYLTKPVSKVDLLKAIQARLQRRQAERQQIERQTERATQLLAGVVHDLRNPLFSMLVCGGLLKDLATQPQQHQARAREIISKLEQAAERMQSILSRTMLLARSKLRQLPFIPERFDLREFCEQLVSEDLQAARLCLQSPPGPFPVDADTFCLRHALENLISNALKYSEGTVTLRLEKRDNSYQIEVSDTGIGIPAKDQASLFQPFFRASNTKGTPGHGLGLCVVQSCIELHGGVIHCRSEAGKGTTFSIDLPMSPPVSSGAPTPSTPRTATISGQLGRVVSPRRPGALITSEPPACDPFKAHETLQAGQAASSVNTPTTGHPSQAGEVGAGPARRLKAIIVEDDPLARDAMRELLQQSNSLVLLGEADTVRQARVLARQQHPEVIFLDVNLPDGPGFDLLHDLTPETAVVFVTSTEEYAARAFDCEAADYLVKPVCLERLQKALSRVRARGAAKAATGEATEAPEDSFAIRTLTGKRLVKVSAITHILAYGEYSWVYWNEEKKGALLRKSLKLWQAELPADHFARVHRRAIVNLDCIDSVHKSLDGRLLIRMRDCAEPITVSLRLAPVLKKKLKTSKGWWP